MRSIDPNTAESYIATPHTRAAHHPHPPVTFTRLSRFREFDEAAAFNDGKNTDFWITQSDTITPLHLAIEAKSREEVEAFYDAALGAGGKDNGKPGYRTEYWPGYYAAFVCDPDGHNIEAVWYDYEKAG